MAASSFTFSFPTEGRFNWADDVEEEIAEKAAEAKRLNCANNVEETPDDLPVPQCMGELAPNNDSEPELESDSGSDSNSDSGSDTTTTAPTTSNPYDHEYYIGYLSTVDILGPKGYRLAATFNDGDMVLNDNGRWAAPQPVLWKRSYLSIVENIDEDTEQPPPPPITSPTLPRVVADPPPPIVSHPLVAVAAIDPPPSTTTTLVLPPLTAPEPPMLPLFLQLPPASIPDPPKSATKPYWAVATFASALMAVGLFEVLVTNLFG